MARRLHDECRAALRFTPSGFANSRRTPCRKVRRFPDCVLAVSERHALPFRISRSVSHLEFVIGHRAPLVFGRPYAMHNGIV
jgi:hypothetical protein